MYIFTLKVSIFLTCTCLQIIIEIVMIIIIKYTINTIAKGAAKLEANDKTAAKPISCKTTKKVNILTSL